MSSNDDYDKLTKEEREVRDKADAEREAAEQAGMFSWHIGARLDHSQFTLSPPIQMETRVG